MFRKFVVYYKPHWKLFAIDMVCAIIVAACNLFYPHIAQNVINSYIPNREMTAMLIWLGILLGVFILKMFLTYVIQYWGHIVGVRIQSDMRKKLFSHLEELPFKYYDENKTGQIMSRVINDLFEISELAHHGPEDIFLSFITLIGAGIMMALTIDPWLSLIVFSVVPFVIIFAIIRRKKMKAAFKKSREETGEINARVESSIAGIRVTKAYAASEYEIAKFDQANEDYQNARVGALRQMGIFHSGMGFLTDFLYFLTLLSGGLFFFYHRIDGGQFTGFILYITMIINPIRTFVAIFEQIQNGTSGFARFLETLSFAEEKELPGAVELTGISKDIRFDHVFFKYDTEQNKSNSYILNDLSLRIAKGKTVALVGPSGGGKTTICHLIPRFYELNSGEILIDGVNINEFTFKSLRSQIGIVAQDVFLFGGSIKENIAYGKTDISMEEIIAAAKKANIHDFIMTLTDGYETDIGERGVKLSGGQKQRISIARAFLKNPPILILDEATSALDNVTEMQIQNSLETLSKGRTTIVVAHRLSTVKNADEIIVINEKGIEERGTHQELVDFDGVYAHLYQYQFKQ